jgi:hypothetical protein
MLPGRKPAYVSIADFLASSPRQSSLSPSDSLLVEVKKGADQTWYSVESGWTGYKKFQVQMPTAGDQVVVTATATSGQQYRATLPLSNTAVKALGVDGDARLLRIDGNRTQLGMTLVTTSAAAAEAESPAPSSARLAAPITEDSSLIDDTPDAVPEEESAIDEAEGEAPSAAISLSVAEPIAQAAPVTLDSATESLVAGLWAPPEVVSTIDVQPVTDAAMDGTSSTKELAAGDEAQRVDAILASEDLVDELADPEFVLLASQDPSDDYAQAVDTVLAAEAL